MDDAQSHGHGLQADLPAVDASAFVLALGRSQEVTRDRSWSFRLFNDANQFPLLQPYTETASVSKLQRELAAIHSFLFSRR
jgi:hypothetical protein